MTRLIIDIFKKNYLYKKFFNSPFLYPSIFDFKLTVFQYFPYISPLPYNICQLNNLVLLQSWLQLFLEFGGEEEKYRNILHVLENQLKKPNKNKNYDRWQKAIDCFVYLEKNCLGDGRKF